MAAAAESWLPRGTGRGVVMARSVYEARLRHVRSILLGWVADKFGEM